MINCNCPRCGSRNTKALSVIHAYGSRRQQWKTNGSHIGVPSFSFGFRRTRGWGESQTIAATNAAPPSAQSATKLGAVTSIVLVVTALVLGFSAFLYVLGGLLILAVVAGLVEGQSTDRLHATWVSTFQCGRCGITFVADQTCATRRDDPQPHLNSLASGHRLKETA